MICIAWGGMPAYAACAIAEFIRRSKEPVTLIGTASDVPKTCSDTIAGVPIHWIEDEADVTIMGVIGEVPRVLVVDGWFIPSFNRLVHEMRDASVPVITLCDNRCKWSLKLLPWVCYFHFLIRPRFNGFMVPGSSGKKLLRLGGVKEDCVEVGMYSCDPSQFCVTTPIVSRLKRIVFVGRYDVRKNIVPFARAFLSLARDFPDWKLACYGQGPLQNELQSVSAMSNGQIEIHEFLQPSQLAAAYQNARVFVLPSLDDHWGVVVHEAAQCGCAILASREVGATEDLCSHANSRLFQAKSERGMCDSLREILSWHDDEWSAAEAESVRLAKRFSPAIFAANLDRLIERVSMP